MSVIKGKFIQINTGEQRQKIHSLWEIRCASGRAEEAAVLQRTIDSVKHGRRQIDFLYGSTFLSPAHTHKYTHSHSVVQTTAERTSGR
jgi:hypothetical protein